MLTLCIDKTSNTWANRLLNRTVQLIEKKTAEDAINSIILTGSFSRGEASITHKDNRYSLAGDLEFLLVAPTGNSLSKLIKKSHALKSSLVKQLSQEFNTPVDVDLGFVGTDYFQCKIRPSIFNYDLIHNGKVVAGVDLFPKHTLFANADIPREDALELLMNRAIELMDLKVAGEEEALNYHYIKIILDMAGSALAFSGNYISSYLKRYEAIKGLVKSDWWQKSTIPASPFLETLLQASTLKTSIIPGVDKTNLPDFCGENVIENWLAQLIINEMSSLAAEESLSTKKLLDKYVHLEKRGSILRCWAKFILHPTRPPGTIDYFHLAHRIVKSSPRRLIYSAAMKCFFHQTSAESSFIDTVKDDLSVFHFGKKNHLYIDETLLLWKSYIRHN